MRYTEQRLEWRHCGVCGGRCELHDSDEGVRTEAAEVVVDLPLSGWDTQHCSGLIPLQLSAAKLSEQT